MNMYFFVNVPGISDHMRTVRAVCVYAYTLRPYAFGVAPLISILHLQMVQIEDEHNIYCLKWLCLRLDY